MYMGRIFFQFVFFPFSRDYKSTRKKRGKKAAFQSGVKKSVEDCRRDRNFHDFQGIFISFLHAAPTSFPRLREPLRLSLSWRVQGEGGEHALYRGRARRGVKLSTKALISDRRGGRIDGYARRNDSESEAREGENCEGTGEKPFAVVATYDAVRTELNYDVVRGTGRPFLMEEIFVYERPGFE